MHIWWICLYLCLCVSVSWAVSDGNVGIVDSVGMRMGCNKNWAIGRLVGEEEIERSEVGIRCCRIEARSVCDDWTWYWFWILYENDFLCRMIRLYPIVNVFA